MKPITITEKDFEYYSEPIASMLENSQGKMYKVLGPTKMLVPLEDMETGERKIVDLNKL